MAAAYMALHSWRESCEDDNLVRIEFPANPRKEGCARFWLCQSANLPLTVDRTHGMAPWHMADFGRTDGVSWVRTSLDVDERVREQGEREGCECEKGIILFLRNA